MRALLAVLLLGVTAGAAPAQDAPPRPPVAAQSPVVVLDRDALYAQSRFGRRIARDIEIASRELAAENGRIEVELEAEEQALTEQRARMDKDAFLPLAAAFDARVTAIRETQDAKARALAQQNDRAQTLFFERANPVLVELARETGALVILDRRIVIASADQVDITALAARRIDAVLGEGEGPDTAPPIPRPARPAPTETPPAD